MALELTILVGTMTGIAQLVAQEIEFAGIGLLVHDQGRIFGFQRRATPDMVLAAPRPLAGGIRPAFPHGFLR